jgi:metallo-beta-lactamase family protein
MKLGFLGAAEEVTGSCFLVETGRARFLVDCGLFQGGREADAKNRSALDFDVNTLDFVLLTHAHLDHSGLLPRLVAFGFKGPIFTTEATADLLGVMLADSAFINERDAEWKRREGKRVDPLYTVKQAEAAIRQVRTVRYDSDFAPCSGISACFRDAGHILGSAIIEIGVKADGAARKLVFSGDIGQPGHPVVRDPARIAQADVLVVESTYGNRLHKTMGQTLEEFVRAVTDTFERGGNVIVPAFAVGRTQSLLYLIVKLYREGRLPPFEVYVDSPMALAATEVTLRHLDLADEDAKEALRWIRSSGGRPRIRFVEQQAQSIALNSQRSDALIISASGMCDAGRIKHHLKHNLPRPECSILFTGFQAAGTLGRRIVDGSNTVRIFGEDVPVRAQVHTIGGLSAHADRDALLGWLKHFRQAPRQVFVVHGEMQTAHDFAATVRERFGWNAVVPAPGSAAAL